MAASIRDWGHLVGCVKSARTHPARTKDVRVCKGPGASSPRGRTRHGQKTCAFAKGLVRQVRADAPGTDKRRARLQRAWCVKSARTHPARTKDVRVCKGPGASSPRGRTRHGQKTCAFAKGRVRQVRADAPGTDKRRARLQRAGCVKSARTHPARTKDVRVCKGPGASSPRGRTRHGQKTCAFAK